MQHGNRASGVVVFWNELAVISSGSRRHHTNQSGHRGDMIVNTTILTTPLGPSDRSSEPRIVELPAGRTDREKCEARRRDEARTTPALGRVNSWVTDRSRSEHTVRPRLPPSSISAGSIANSQLIRRNDSLPSSASSLRSVFPYAAGEPRPIGTSNASWAAPAAIVPQLTGVPPGSPAAPSNSFVATPWWNPSSGPTLQSPVRSNSTGTQVSGLDFGGLPAPTLVGTGTGRGQAVFYPAHG